MTDLITTLTIDQPLNSTGPGILAVDANILIDLAASNTLDILKDIPNRNIVVTQEVLFETTEKPPTTSDPVERQRILDQQAKIDAFFTENLGTGSGEVQIYNSSTMDNLPLFTGRGAGENSIFRFTQEYGTAAAAGGRGADIIVVGRNPKDGLGSGDSVLGSSFESVLDTADLMASMVVRGLMSPHDFLSNMSDLDEVRNYDKFGDLSFYGQNSEGSLRIPIYETEEGVIRTGSIFSLGPKYSIGSENDEFVGYIELGEPSSKVVIFGNDDVVFDSTATASITQVEGIDLELKIRKIRIDLYDGDEYIVEVQDVHSECFGPEVPIDMWPLGPDLKPGPDGIYDQDAVRAKVWKKPIKLIRVGDLVVSFDEDGNLVPGPVTRTFQNNAKILLDFHGTRVTPGHVYYRPDSKKSYKYGTLIDVLRDDGVIQKQDGTLIRAATNVPVDSPSDGFVRAVSGRRKADGTFEQTDEGRIRLGTRFLIGTGKERKSWAVADLIERNGGVVGEDELIHVGDGPGVPLTWDFGDTLSKPEDFVLACSGTTLEDIYKAAEWESQGPRLPAPTLLDRGPVQPLKGAALSAMPRNEPLNVAHAPVAAAMPQRILNRKQRKAMDAKQRKAAKARKRIAV